MVTIEVTHDMELVREIITIPEIWDNATEDGIDPEYYIPTNNALSAWLICRNDEEIIGLILIHHDNTASLKVHPYLLNKYMSLGREMMTEIFKWFLTLPVHKLLASIPENHKKAYNFVKKMGFKDEGFNRASYMKNGTLYGQWMLGITKKEIEELV